MGESLWLPGTVADCYVKAGGAQWMPYQIDLDRGDACYAQSDDPRLIRNVGGAGEDLAWNDRTQTMEVAATASLVFHPSSSRVAIGMWHTHAAAGVLYSVDIGPHGASDLSD